MAAEDRVQTYVTGLVPFALVALISQLLQAAWGQRGPAIAVALAVGAAFWAAPAPNAAGPRRRWPAVCWLTLSALALAWRVTMEPVPPASPGSVEALCASSPQSSRRLLVELRESPRIDASGWRGIVEARALLVDGGWRPLSGRLRLSIRHPAQAPWPTATRLVFDSSLRWIENWGNPGEFDWRGWNRRRGVFVSAFVWSARAVENYPASDGGGAVERVRTALTTAALAGQGRGAALVAAMVTGLRSGLPDADVRALRDTGLAHLLAISGLHMGMVAGAVLWLGRWPLAVLLGARRGIDALGVAAYLAAAAVLAYAGISGGGVSVTRAVVMVLAALFALASGHRRHPPLQALSAALLLLSLRRPGVATEVGFQLSFAAATVLLLRAKAWGRQHRNDRSRIRNAIEISLLTWSVTTPIVAHHFHRVSILAPLANLLVAPAAAASVLLGLSSAGIAGLWSAAAGPGFWLAARCGDLVFAIAALLARCPGAGLRVLDPGAGACVLLLLAVFAWASRASRRRQALLLLSLLLLLLFAVQWRERYRDDRMDLYFVSVGHGDAIVVRLPGGKVVVVDGGARGRGARVVAPLLRRLRIGRIDYLVVSHLQSDHWSGAAELAAEFPVGELWYGGGVCELASFEQLADRLQGEGSRVIAVGERHAAGGKVVAEGGRNWRMEALWPADEAGSCQANGRSVVLAIRFAGFRVLLTGDLDRAAESRLRLSGAVLRAEVLKVAHHGSAGSSSGPFLEAVAPRLAIVSASAGGRSGLPAQAALERLRRAGARVYRTDRDGAVVVSIGRRGAAVSSAKRL